MKRIRKILPGVLCSAAVAAAAVFLADALPLHLISASVVALFLGMALRALRRAPSSFDEGISFTSKRLLRFAIVLLGASLDLATVIQIGTRSLIIMVFTLATCFGLGYLSGRLLKLNWKVSNLISAGTGICGGSAIAAIAPVIEASSLDIAFAMSATFIFDMVMILLFPYMGRAFGMSDAAYGLWSGTAVNDTSSVVAAGYAFSEAAGDFAVMVKLTRTLSIIPVVIIFSCISAYLRRRDHGSEPQPLTATLRRIFPAFILGFLALAACNSFGLIPAELASALKSSSKFLMVMALAAIGLSTSMRDMKNGGGAAMLHGFIVSALVVVVALAVIAAQQSFGLL